MRIESCSIIVDSYAWIEFFAGTKLGEVVRKYVEEAREVYTPSIVLAEIARKYAREGIPWNDIVERLKVIEDLSTVVYMDRRVALESAKAYLELVNHARNLGLKSKPSLVDAVILAMARILKAKILSGDEHFRGLDNVIWLK